MQGQIPTFGHRHDRAHADHQRFARGVFDVFVGINLLREGLDIPEVTLVTILDADKEGFLRSETSLIQTCGRASRNVEGRVIMYADVQTKSIKRTLEITEKRRAIQTAYNERFGIVPKTVRREISPLIVPDEAAVEAPVALPKTEVHEYLTADEIESKIRFYEREMKEAAKNMDFEEAAKFRDLMRKFQQLEINYG